MSIGWTAFDDPSLRASSSGTGSARGPGVQGQPLSREAQAEAEQPSWRVDNTPLCAEEEDCLATGTRRPLPGETRVGWVAMEELEGALPRTPKASTAPPGSKGTETPSTIVVKRYFFSGQAVAMRRDGELLFLRPDHLGSASLILDEDGRWLADHRFYPYGEIRRSDGASATNPTDRMFTGMLFDAFDP